MTKLEEYTAKAEASLAAIESAKTDRDRAFHRNAHSIWRKLIRGLTEADAPGGSRVIAPAPVKSARASPTPATMKTVTLSGL